MEESQQGDPQEPLLPAPPGEPEQPITSRFLFVDVAAMRAKQLRRGARVRIGPGAVAVSLPRKAERLAMEEVRRGLVYYNLPESTPRAEGAGA